MIAARMIGETEVHRWTDHRAAKNFFEKAETFFPMRFAGQNQGRAHRALRVTNRCFDTWLLLLRRPERSLSGDVFMDLISLLIQIISGAVRGTLWAIRSKTKNNQL
jgi:hypothetical protein